MTKDAFASSEWPSYKSQVCHCRTNLAGFIIGIQSFDPGVNNFNIQLPQSQLTLSAG